LLALENGKEAKIGIVLNVPQFDPWNSWNPLDVLTASAIDYLFNGCVINYFKTGKFWFLGAASVNNPR